ncbi:hypothetical protein AB0K09_29540 [Streptomyces sp. NPDC049577]|uniref:hypothetical protein n=1 Tax=Streptomyces sp. NPDC049577 TaxID=3155153 RepID=UPI0034369966
MMSATVCCDTCQPSSHKSSVILGEPYVRPEQSKKQRTRSARPTRLISRCVGWNGRRRHV